MSASYENLLLPPSVVSKADLSRLVSELEWVDNEQTTAAIREKAGAPAQGEQRVSRQCADFLLQNKLPLASSQERSLLIKQLRALKDAAPVIHMTFAVPADPESLQKLALWVRASLHPQAVIEAGLQPALVAGVSVRTPNHVHDLSMRASLEKSHGALVKELGALRGNG